MEWVKPEKVAVITDAMKEMGFPDFMVKWLEHPNAVLQLFSAISHEEGSEYVTCSGCGEAHPDAHMRGCSVVDAWRSLGWEERIENDIYNAWNDALHEKNLRARGMQPYGPNAGNDVINDVINEWFKESHPDRETRLVPDRSHPLDSLAYGLNNAVGGTGGSASGQHPDNDWDP